MTEKREGDRRRNDRRAGSASRALVPTGEVKTDDTARPAKSADPAPSDPAFSAQLMGQGGGRKGLRGGPPVLNAARSGYLGAEYSGDQDRRPKPGELKKTDV